MKELILFVLTFFLIFIIYQMLIVRKAKNKKKPKKPMEVQLLENKYKLDLNKIDYSKLLMIISLVSAFDISIIVTIISFIEGFGLQMLAGFATTIPLIFISYGFIGRYYKKKGMTKNV